MWKLKVVQIQGRQYPIVPDGEILVDYLGDIKEYKTDQVLLVVDGSKVDLGKPFVKDEVKFNVIESVRTPKIRVAKYSAKANYRKVRGSRSTLSKLKVVS